MDLIIFDLDGTLVDSRQDIATSVNELLTRLGRPGLPSEQVFDFIGNGVVLPLYTVGDAYAFSCKEGAYAEFNANRSRRGPNLTVSYCTIKT